MQDKINHLKKWKLYHKSIILFFSVITTHPHTMTHCLTYSQQLYLELIVTVAMIIMPCKTKDWDLTFWLNAGKTRGRTV